MTYAVSEESLANLNSYWSDSKYNLNWNSIFISPGWLQVWWQVFGNGADIFLRVVGEEKQIIGIAPLLVRGNTASFLGSVDVCDYQDFIVAPGKETDFFSSLLEDLRKKGINHLDLGAVRHDATVLTWLVPMAQKLGYDVSCAPEAVSLELDLPPTWDDYLELLNTKQRHEIRRKLRRLSETGKVDYHFVDKITSIPDAMDTFIKLFTESRQDKAAFLTAPMESFFRTLADTMAGAGMLKLGVLELDTRPMAMIMGFDYKDTLYLYNSGFNREYDFLSVGLLSKVLAIKDSIQRGKKRFDFLKGAEPYKYQLGGREVPLSRCRITIK